MGYLTVFTQPIVYRFATTGAPLRSATDGVCQYRRRRLGVARWEESEPKMGNQWPRRKCLIAPFQNLIPKLSYRLSPSSLLEKLLKVISSPSQRKKEKRKRKKKEIIPQRFLSSSVGGKESFHKWITREFSTFSPSPVLLSFSRFFLLSLFNLFFHPFSLAAELWLTDPLARRSHTQKRGNPFCYVGDAKRSVCFDGPLIKSFSFHQWTGNLNHSFFKSSILYSCSASKCLYSKGASPGRICTWKRSVILVSFDECNLHSEQPLRTSHQHNSIKFCDAGWECRISN